MKGQALLPHISLYIQGVHVSDCSSRHDDIVQGFLEGPTRQNIESEKIVEISIQTNETDTGIYAKTFK